MSVPIDEVTPDMATDLAQRFVDLSRSVSGIDLDYSVSSLDNVDHVIEDMRNEGLSVNDVFRMLFVAGCYVGEVMRREKGLRWVTAEGTLYEDANDISPIVIEFAPEGFTSPIGKAIKRLENGEEDSIAYYYQVLCKIMEDPPSSKDHSD